MIKHLILLKIQKHDRYQCGLASMVYTCFNKKCYGDNTSGVTVTRANKSTIKIETISWRLT